MELQYKSFETEIKAVGEDGSRRMSFLISTGAIDRDNDTLDPKGWKLDNYRKNPIVAFGHNYRELPVAKCVEIRSTDKGLEAVAEFPPKGIHAFADTVHDMVKGGFLSATSVGFRPIEYEEDRQRKGFNFKSQELTEFSIVPIPSNPDALVQLRGGQADAQVRHWTKALLDWASAAAKTAARAQLGRLIPESEPWTKNEQSWKALEQDYETETAGQSVRTLSVARFAKLLALHGFENEAKDLGKTDPQKMEIELHVDEIACAVVEKLLKPMPTPEMGEQQNDFMGRCMSALKTEFPEQAQRTAVCMSQWRRHKREAPEIAVRIVEDPTEHVSFSEDQLKGAIAQLGPELATIIAGQTDAALKKAMGRID